MTVTVTDETNEQRAAFVDAVASGVDPVDAARLARLPDPPEAARRLLGLPGIRRALVDVCAARLASELIPLALNTCAEIMRDETAASSIRGRIALGMISQAFQTAKQAEASEAGGKTPLETMTLRELQEYVAAREAGLTRAPTLDVAPGNPAQTDGMGDES